MKTPTLIVLLALAGCASHESAAPPDGTPPTTAPLGTATSAAAAPAKEPERAKQLISNGAVVLDVRTPDEFSTGHLDQAVNLPIDELATKVPRSSDSRAETRPSPSSSTAPRADAPRRRRRRWNRKASRTWSTAGATTISADGSNGDRRDAHRRGFWLADAVLGGQDGLVNVLGVVLGVAASTAQTRIVVVAGLACAVAEALSMAAVAYTASRAQADLYQAERAREYRHIAAAPELEREEVRMIYAAKGFSGELLDRIVATITSDKDVWVAVMMAEEHKLNEVDLRSSLRSAVVVGLSAIVGSLIPILPFLLLPAGAASIAGVALAACALFALGAYKARVTVGRPLRSGLEIAVIGSVAAAAGYLIGALFPAGP